MGERGSMSIGSRFAVTRSTLARRSRWLEIHWLEIRADSKSIGSKFALTRSTLARVSSWLDLIFKYLY